MPPRAAGSEALLDRPETAEDRVQSALADLDRFCGERGEECAAYAEPRRYPNVQVPENTRRYVNDRQQEVRTLGFEIRWDPGTSRYDIVAGNSPTFRGDPRSDPP